MLNFSETYNRTFANNGGDKYIPGGGINPHWAYKKQEAVNNKYDTFDCNDLIDLRDTLQSISNKAQAIIDQFSYYTTPGGVTFFCRPGTLFVLAYYRDK